jgi:SHAQKYF class myb-like DNA-binding protein
VAAIFDVGLKHSSPSSILECMAPNDKLNSERIKSHLQKYRLHRAKSKEAFMTSYETTLHRLHEGGGGTADPLDPGEAMEGGAIAAHLTYTSTTAAADGVDDDAAVPVVLDGRSQQPSSRPARPREGTLILPRLTEEEKESPIGTSMGYLMGLFFTLTQQLMAQRSEREKEEPGAAAHARSPAGLYDSAAAAGDPHAASSSHAAAAAPAPSTRSNLEENSLMKREMQSQMAFQNKMRALKLEELKKWRRSSSSESAGGPQPPETSPGYHQHQHHPHAASFQPPPSLPHATAHQRQHPSEGHHRHSSSYGHAAAAAAAPPSLASVAFALDVAGAGGSALEAAAAHRRRPQHQADAAVYSSGDYAPHPAGFPLSPPPPDQQHQHQRPHQGAGEVNDGSEAAGEAASGAAPSGDRSRALSFGAASDDIWNADVLDDHLFEFLMDN